MTVPSTTNRNDFDGAGSTATFAYTFKVTNQSHLSLAIKNDSTEAETSLTITTQYTVTGVGDASGGSVVLVDDGSDWIDASGFLKSGYSLVIRRVVPLTHSFDIRNQGDFFPETHEDAFDYFIWVAQQQQDEIDRAVKFTEASETTGISMPEPSADKAIFWNALGTALENRSLDVTSGTFPGDFSAGLDASKAASPSTNDVYIATDTQILYICFASPTWVSYGGNIASGLDASKAASPSVGDVYIATDTLRVYACFSAGIWSSKRTYDLAVDWAKGADIASATTTDIGAATGNYIHVTGTVTITGLGTVQAGTLRIVRFAGVLLLTHNATSLILPSGANITTAANDVAVMVSEGSGNWRCVDYQKADGTALSSGSLVGHVIQVVNVLDGAVATGTTLMLDDDSIPQNAEGDEFMTLAITPSNTNNKLKIDVVVNLATNATNTNNLIVALFQDTTVGALAAASVIKGDGGVGNDLLHQINFTHYMVAGTTSSTIFKVRAGGEAINVVTFNGISSGRKFGGVMPSSITITEIKV